VLTTIPIHSVRQHLSDFLSTAEERCWRPGSNGTVSSEYDAAPLYAAPSSLATILAIRKAIAVMVSVGFATPAVQNTDADAT
jgi:hypothetical protein